MEVPMAFCPKCGSEIDENDQYCYNCGNPIKGRQNQVIQENVSHNYEIVQRGSSPLKKGGAVAFLIASILYSFFLPVDVLPDVVPAIGWIDDAGMLLISTLNMIQVYIQDRNSFIACLLKVLKWILIVLIVLVVLIVGGLIAFIVSLFK